MAPVRKNFLIISPHAPDPAHGSGRRLAGIIAALYPHGDIDLIITYPPGFYPADSAIRSTHIIDLAEKGFFARVGSLLNKAVPFCVFGHPRLKRHVALMCRQTSYSLIICRYGKTLERLGRVKGTKILLDVDDVEYERWAQAGRLATDWRSKLRCGLQAFLARYLLKKVMRSADYCWVVRADTVGVIGPAKTWVMPNVAFATEITTCPVAVESNFASDTMVFIGYLGYAPNQEGIDWFIQTVWPIIQAVAPALKLDVVGAAAPESTRRLINQSANIRLRGFLPSLSEVYASAAFCINPCRTGSGTHIKIIEAMLHGRIVITTPFGVRGWEEANQKCGCPVIAADAEEFAAQCLRYHSDKEATALLAQKALAFARLYGTMEYFRNQTETFLRDVEIIR